MPIRDSHNYVLKLDEVKSSPNRKTVLEFGVQNGETITALRNSFDSSFEVIGFDSFEGLPEDGPKKSGWPKGAFSTGGNIPVVSGVKFYKGWFKDTLPQYLNDDGGKCKDIALLHIDCDLYSSTTDVLNFLNNNIVAGTFIVFDEWHYGGNRNNILNSECHAFLNWARRFYRTYEIIPVETDSESRAVLITS